LQFYNGNGKLKPVSWKRENCSTPFLPWLRQPSSSPPATNWKTNYSRHFLHRQQM
jgi:hypothetical protein